MDELIRRQDAEARKIRYVNCMTQTDPRMPRPGERDLPFECQSADGRLWLFRFNHHYFRHDPAPFATHVTAIPYGMLNPRDHSVKNLRGQDGYYWSQGWHWTAQRRVNMAIDRLTSILEHEN